MTRNRNRQAGSGGMAGQLLRRASAAAAAGLLVLSMGGLPALAASYSLDMSVLYNGNAVTGGELNVYRIATVTQGDKGYEYAWTNEAFSELSGGQTPEEEITAAKEGVTADQHQSDFESWLADNPEAAEDLLVGTVSYGNSIDTGSWGLFLVTQESGQIASGYYRLSPFWITLTAENLAAGTADTYVNASYSKASPLRRGGGGGGGGGGSTPPRPTPPTNPPSEGSVLGASRDSGSDTLVPPEVLGASRLPQTGQLWWPVPVLDVLGMAMIAVGIVKRKKASRAAEGV